jgi:hypothetical protein
MIKHDDGMMALKRCCCVAHQERPLSEAPETHEPLPAEGPATAAGSSATFGFDPDVLLGSQGHISPASSRGSVDLGPAPGG